MWITSKEEINMKLKKFLKNFCFDKDINTRVDILIYDKMNENHSTLTVATELAGTLYYGVETENVHLNMLCNLNFERCSNPMEYLLNLPVRMIMGPKNPEAAVSILVEEYEPEDIMHKTKDVHIEIKDDNGKVVSAGGRTKKETFICYRKLVDIKNRKKQALKAVRPKKNAKVKKVKKDTEKSNTPSSETSK